MIISRDAYISIFVLESIMVKPTQVERLEKCGNSLKINCDNLLHMQPSTSKDTIDTSTLYDELDSFRNKWRRELNVLSNPVHIDCNDSNDSLKLKNVTLEDEKENEYDKAKRLFLIAVRLEQDDQHYESIAYYKQAMKLLPDIEKLIFKEQCELSAKDNLELKESQDNSYAENPKPKNDIDLLSRIRTNFNDDKLNIGYSFCRPAFKMKSGSTHLSSLPYELFLLILRWVIGEELDLHSLQQFSLVNRGFYLLSRDPSIWRGICYKIWGDNTLAIKEKSNRTMENVEKNVHVNWINMFKKRPRVSFNGVYKNRTKYIRTGDSCFQDMTYRPFHVVRYYRYLRFFPDQRVLVMTTTEEPDRVLPMFRNATNSSHFSPELSVLDGSFEISKDNQITITAERDCKIIEARSRFRGPYLPYSKQTPKNQKFVLKFQLSSNRNRNNTLDWLSYSIITRLDNEQNVTSFEINDGAFPELTFHKMEDFKYKIDRPLVF